MNEEIETSPRSYQFSLGFLMKAVTVGAILCAESVWVSPYVMVGICLIVGMVWAITVFLS